MARYLQSRSHSRSCGKLTDVLFRLEECEIRADCPIPGNVLACLDYDRGACPSVPRLLAFTPAHTAATEGIISELEALDPVAAAVTSSNRHPDSWVPNQLLSPNVVEFSKRLKKSSPRSVRLRYSNRVTESSPSTSPPFRRNPSQSSTGGFAWPGYRTSSHAT